MTDTTIENTLPITVDVTTNISAGKGWKLDDRKCEAKEDGLHEQVGKMKRRLQQNFSLGSMPLLKAVRHVHEW